MTTNNTATNTASVRSQAVSIIKSKFTKRALKKDFRCDLKNGKLLVNNTLGLMNCDNSTVVSAVTKLISNPEGFDGFVKPNNTKQDNITEVLTTPSGKYFALYESIDSDNGDQYLNLLIYKAA